MHRFPDIPPVWLVGGLGLVAGLWRWWPVADFGSGRLRLLGGALVVAGVVLIFASAFWFWRKHTSIEPGDTPRVLIRQGPYRLSRNPIYLGMVIILSGAVLASGSLSAVLIVPGFIVLISRRFIRSEEVMLRATFGAEAERYLAATRRWL